MGIEHELTIEKAEQIAAQYIGTTMRLSRLGWGISGFVFLAPDKKSAIKVYKTIEGYQSEVAAYRILRRARLRTLHGLTIPRMQKFKDEFRLVQMDFVSPPFLLDFAGVLFEPPDFADDVKTQWYQEIENRFGKTNQWIAHAVYSSLQEYGMYYVDFRTTNLNPRGHPEMVDEPPDHDEPY